MHDILRHMRQVTGQLREVQQKLYESEQVNPGTAAAFVEEAAAVEVMAEFKVAVDDLRRFLWFYIEELGKGGGGGEAADQAMMMHRVRRATELLRVLTTEHDVKLQQLPEAKSFFDEVHTVVDTYMRKRDN